MSAFSLLYGFVTKADIEGILKPFSPGTFMLRFSENNPGQIAVAYNVADGNMGMRVKHYLVKPTG